MPAIYVLDEGVADAIAAYVEAGGTLVVTARSGVKDECNNVVNMKLPGLLAEVCGVEVEEYDSLSLERSQPLTFADETLDPAGTAKARAWCDVLEPTTAETVAAYTDDFYAGRAAVTANRYGDGTAYYVGTFGNGDLYRTLAPLWCAAAKVEPLAFSTEGVEICRRQQGDRAIWFVLNHTAQEQQVDLPDGLVDLSNSGQAVGNRLTLSPRDVRILVAE